MWTRVLCLALLLSTAPVSAWAAGWCCEPSTDCYEEAPSCPILPSGECALAGGSHAVATVIVAPGLTSPAPAPGTPVQEAAAAPAHRPPDHASRSPDHPRFLLLRCLRI